jgi:DNA-binding SARP family transcriptional activator
VATEQLPADLWGRAQVRQLLQFLLLQPGCAAGRDRLLEAFWPESPLQQARELLRVCLHRLRKALQSIGCDLETTPDLIRLPPGTVGWVDHLAVRSHLAAAQRAALIDPTACLRHCRTGWGLCRGALLADVDAGWADEARAQFQRELGHLLHLWQEAALRLDRTDEAITVSEEILTLDPGQEEALRTLVVLLWQSGRRGDALARYRRFARWLRAEFGVEPSTATQLAVAQLQD